MTGISDKKLNVMVMGIVIVLVLFALYAQLVPATQTEAEQMNTSNRCTAVGCWWNASASTNQCQTNNTAQVSCATDSAIPLSGLFSSTGVVFIMIMIGLLVLIIRNSIPGKK